MKFFNFLILSIIAIMLTIPIKAHSKSVDDLFLPFYKTINCAETSSDPILLDYSIEILKYKPNSLESMYIFSLFSRVTLSGEIHKKYILLKDNLIMPPFN